uniref:ENTH domain-containing protein n=1 Tax=Oryza punctata TaxID=4537 RepID=A0A0E0JRU0_ORYPU
MAPSKLRAALGAVKDRTSVGLARVGGADEVAADLAVAIVKATAHGESAPGDERHVQEILTLTCYSRARVAACVAAVSRRLGRTRAWAVAVKALALVHRLLADGDPAYEQEVFLATRRGRRMLDVSHRFPHRSSRSRAWDFHGFVRAYAAYLDDRLKHRMKGRVASQGKWCFDGRRDGFPDTDGRYEVGEAVAEVWALVPRDTPATGTTTEELVSKAQHLKHILQRFIGCRPTGKARTNNVVTAALHRLVKESGGMYRELTEVMTLLVDRFAELETPGCVRVHSIFTSIAKLFDELDDFYSWCRAAAICRPSEIPEVEHVAQKKLDLMDEFIRDRQAAASRWWKCSPPGPSSPRALIASNGDTDATKPLPARKVQGENNVSKAAPAEPAPAGALVVVDDHMADFMNLGEESTPLLMEEQERNLTLSLFGDDPATPAPKWETFDDDQCDDWETALVQSASKFATQSATVLALPPPPGATGGEVADLFAASLAVPPPTYVQMMDMQARQRLFVNEQMMWQQFERQQMAAWSYNTLL